MINGENQNSSTNPGNRAVYNRIKLAFASCLSALRIIRENRRRQQEKDVPTNDNETRDTEGKPACFFLQAGAEGAQWNGFPWRVMQKVSRKIPERP